MSVCLSCPVCDVGVLWPNGWTDQDETWHAGRPHPWPHCFRWDPDSPPQRGVPQIFGPRLLRRNGCMDQDATRHEARPRPRRLCVRWGPRSPSQIPKRGRSPQIFGPCSLWPNGMEIGLRPGDFVLDGDPVTLPKKGAEPPPNFGPMFIEAKWLDGSRCHLARRQASAQVIVC